MISGDLNSAVTPRDVARDIKRHEISLSGYTRYPIAPDFPAFSYRNTNTPGMFGYINGGLYNPVTHAGYGAYAESPIKIQNYIGKIIVDPRDTMFLRKMHALRAQIISIKDLPDGTIIKKYNSRVQLNNPGGFRWLSYDPRGVLELTVNGFNMIIYAEIVTPGM